MMKFIQVTYPFLLVWVAFNHRKVANLEESLSQVKQTTDKNEELLHPDISPDHDAFIEKGMTDVSEDEGSKMIEDINHLNAKTDKEATTSFEGSVVNSKNKKYNPNRETFNLATHKPQKKDVVDLHIRRDYGNYERKSVDRKQRKLSRDELNLKRKETDSSYDRKLYKNNTSYNTTTTCVLLSDLDSIDISQYKSNNSITTFDFTLDLMTDDYAHQTYWKLLPQNSNDTIIDSSDENETSSELVDSTLHKFEYRCVVSGEETNEIQLENICYNFELHDSKGDGICCEYGLGYFSLSLNNNTTPIVADRLYLSSLTSPFCLGDKNMLENELDASAHYPTRECLHDVCICNSKPRLSNIKEDDEIFNTKVLTINEIMMRSDFKALDDYESPQYKAACWVLHDDVFFLKNSFEIEKRQERMMQRYLLALLYFATTPEKWDNHYRFLSSKSECEWNDGPKGIFCDEDSNVQIISLDENNLEGTIVDELSELRSLEYLNLFGNNIHGTISTMLGRLSELRYLDLGLNDLEGTIPSILGRLFELRVLNLERNVLLKGTIPPQLFNLTNLERLYLDNNRLEGTIPETIGNLQKLSYLQLELNKLSGSIPDALNSLENLERLFLDSNKLSSSISTLIGNMNRLEWLDLADNMLTGQIPSTFGSLLSMRNLFLSNNRVSGSIPSTIGNMTSLEWLRLNNNKLSGPIPESLFDLPDIGTISLEGNSVTGSIHDEICERSNFIEADCRNDVFDPKVRCSCCDYCTDETPTWDGGCTDATIRVEIDLGGIWFSSNLEWSLTNDSSGKKILYGGPYSFENGLDSYKTCAANSDCFSINQVYPPLFNTNYKIYWNNFIYNGTFLGLLDNDNINRDDPLQTLLSFSYNEENEQLDSCGEKEFICGEEEQPITLKPNTMERIIYDQANKISGKTVIHNTSFPQSKALCWMFNNNHYDNKLNISDTDIIQRYVLAILHVMSPDGLFGNHEYPPNTHECDWNGITCKDNNTNIVTGISILNQFINGTIIKELGSLKYLEALDLSQTQLYGSIPRTFANLWSLKGLILSGNGIGGTIPATLFHQLNKLELIDLSDNSLSGSINEDIGSYSNIHILSLSKNKLTGPLPLDKFKHRELEHLDIGENELSEIDFPILLEHTKLKFLDISSNFFVGSLLDHTFISLSQLQYFNISQNDFSGTIPTTFPELSNITHFDAHVNKLKGPIPLGITELRSIHHLNLQGNKLTGSLPSELNQLKSLDTLALGHNELKGSIPFDQENLQNIKTLHLQNNKLEGEAPQFSNMIYYITDCGFPSDSLDKVTCSSCNTCCNSDGGCQSKSSERLNQISSTLIFMFTIVGSIIMCYALKDRITSNKYLESFFEEKVKNWNALMLISDKSVYHFLLIDNKTEWYVAVHDVMSS